MNQRKIIIVSLKSLSGLHGPIGYQIIPLSDESRENHVGIAREGLLLFSNMLEHNRDDVIESGCPIGSLCSELAKDDPALHEKSRQIFVLLRDWVKRQFEATGLTNTDDLAMDLLAKLQGITVMACAFKDVEYVKRSHLEVKNWIDEKTLN